MENLNQVVARAALRALAVRSSGLSLAALIFPPFEPPSFPSATAFGFFSRIGPEPYMPATAQKINKGARLTLIDASPTNGFYHITTEDDQVGWVFASFVSLSPAVPPVTPTPPASIAPCDTPRHQHYCCFVNDQDYWL